MKLHTIINYLGWASGIFGALLMLCGIIGFLTDTDFLGVKYYYNFFFYGNSFIFLGIFLLLGSRCNCYRKEEEKKQ
jgi:hypothetical protein